MGFLDRLRSYERDAVPPETLAKVKAMTNKPDFNVDRMTKASKAAGGLARWCVAVRDYAHALPKVR